MRFFKITTLTAFGLLLIGCGEEDGDSGKVIMQMANQTASSLQGESNNQTPSYFGLKIMAVSLRYVADTADTSAAPLYESGIYLAPSGCTNGGKSEIEKDDKKYEYYQPPGPDYCDATEMEYFDLALPSDEVNSAINAAQYPVVPGVYNQVSICFSSYYSFKVDDYMSVSSELNIASDTTSEFGCENQVLENFEISEGESAIISLDYDLSAGALVATESPSAQGDGNASCVASTTYDLPADEVNNLALLLRAAWIRERPHRESKVLVVCPSGMATAQLLVARLKARFPRLETLNVVSMREIASENLTEDDLGRVVGVVMSSCSYR